MIESLLVIGLVLLAGAYLGGKVLGTVRSARRSAAAGGCGAGCGCAEPEPRSSTSAVTVAPDGRPIERPTVDVADSSLQSRPARHGRWTGAASSGKARSGRDPSGRPR